MEGVGYYLPNTLEAVAASGRASVRQVLTNLPELIIDYADVQNESGAQVSTDETTVLNYLNAEFNRRNSGQSSTNLLSQVFTGVLSAVAAELANTRRFVDMRGTRRGRIQFNSTVSVTLGIEFSRDYGATWGALASPVTYSGGNPYLSDWIDIPNTAKYDGVLLRVIGIGAGIVATLTYIQLDFD